MNTKYDYHITCTDVNGIAHRWTGIYPTLRKAKNEVKWMLTRSCFFNITIWEGCIGGIRVETHRPTEPGSSQI